MCVKFVFSTAFISPLVSPISPSFHLTPPHLSLLSHRHDTVAKMARHGQSPKAPRLEPSQSVWILATKGKSGLTAGNISVMMIPPSSLSQ
ncbi:hypothetical protein CEP54_000430 [Fusarium duplospermum]|uniref:Uncharacterized protein n=1 Tax=Fusarium duplospermum TaxID=1325734 RepID=A0A428R6X6_9HYPO|nr:hypothetical protein CEP54_000430 [Fusarium duplospermum]